MKKPSAIFIYSILLLVFINSSTRVFSQSNDNTIQIGLLTYSPGEELYSVFGHSAIRVRNTITNTDDVYNYGTFDFDNPKFYFGFFSGKLMYTLSKVPFALVLQQTQLENRSLIETPLNLSPAEKSKMVQLLRVNYLPENREYLYDFLYDNCSSKIMDVIIQSTTDSLEYNQRVIPKKSYRRLINSYSKERPWIDIGIDFLMGTPADHRAKGTKISFLPDYLHLLLKNIRLKQEFGFEKSLAQSDIVHTYVQTKNTKVLIQPGVILWSLVLILIISAAFGTYIPGFFRILEKSILILFGCFGLLVIILWAATDHYIFNYNTDLLWANPLLLFIVFLKDSLKQLKIKVKLTYLTTILVLIGILTTMIIERNLNLSALAAIVAISLIHKIHVLRTTDNDPYYNA